MKTIKTNPVFGTTLFLVLLALSLLSSSEDGEISCHSAAKLLEPLCKL